MSSPTSTAPADPTAAGSTTSPTTAPAGRSPEGFSTVTAEITDATGEVCVVCLWLADTADERERGLMGVDDLGGAAGMAFVWDRPADSSFTMNHTLIPLSIAWFDEVGDLVDTAEMTPCTDDAERVCPRYAATASYTLAIETPAGALRSIGIGPGSTVRLVGGSETATCDTVASS